MTKLARIVLRGALLVSALIFVNAWNVADAKMAFIWRQGQEVQVTYRYNDNYTQTRYELPPSGLRLHYHYHDHRHYLRYPGYFIPSYRVRYWRQKVGPGIALEKEDY